MLDDIRVFLPCALRVLDSLFEGSAFKMFLVRWFGRERPTNAGRRGRQARLAIVDAANVDGRRGAPRRPAGGSGLSLTIPSWHAALYDPGELDHR
jgi:hypothetical protein